MPSSKLPLRAVSILLLALVPGKPGWAQSKSPRYPLTLFDNYGCMAKGRVQDCNGKVMRQILSDGKNAIPVLISQLTETARAQKQIADYWGDTRSGDVAFVVLTDLFTESDGQTFDMPGVPNWPTVMNGCNSTASGCWHLSLRKHGRESIRQAWLRAWDSGKKQIEWDSKSSCFRISQN
jgi:hypothetical protein